MKKSHLPKAACQGWQIGLPEVSQHMYSWPNLKPINSLRIPMIYNRQNFSQLPAGYERQFPLDAIRLRVGYALLQFI